MLNPYAINTYILHSITYLCICLSFRKFVLVFQVQENRKLYGNCQRHHNEKEQSMSADRPRGQAKPQSCQISSSQCQPSCAASLAHALLCIWLAHTEYCLQLLCPCKPLFNPPPLTAFHFLRVWLIPCHGRCPWCFLWNVWGARCCFLCPSFHVWTRQGEQARKQGRTTTTTIMQTTLTVSLQI